MRLDKWWEVSEQMRWFKFNDIEKCLLGMILGLSLSCGVSLGSSNDGLVVHLELDDSDGLVAHNSANDQVNGNLIGFSTRETIWEQSNGVNYINIDEGHVKVEGLPTLKSTTWAIWIKPVEWKQYATVISSTFEGAVAGHSLGFSNGDSVSYPRVL